MDLHAALRDFFSTHRFPTRARFLLAVSGGPDSVALASALKDLESELGLRFVVGHVNHKLRGAASEADARFVQRLASGFKWPCEVRRRPVSRLNGNLEANARVQRYDALFSIARRLRCQGIITAHTQEDQVETIFLNLLRGAGLDGLSGMPAVRRWSEQPVPVLRPLIGVSKSEVLEFLHRAHRPFRRDQSNASESFRRNWIRRRLSPALESRFPGFQSRVARLAEILRDENQVWEEFLSRSEKETLRRWRGRTVLDIKRLLSYPAALQRRLLRRRPGGDLLTFDGVEKLRGWLLHPPSGGRVWQLRKGWVAERLSRSQGAPSAHWLWIRPASVARKTA